MRVLVACEFSGTVREVEARAAFSRAFPDLAAHLPAPVRRTHTDS